MEGARPQARAVLDERKQLRTFYIVRHAKAGSREDWTGDDRLRPLTKKGWKQASELIGVLQPFPISAIFSSPYLRCAQTVEPLGKARKIAVKPSTELAEGRGLEGLGAFLGDKKLDHAVLCTHGDIVWELVEDLVKRHVIRAGIGGYDKASTWVVATKDGIATKARYLPAP